MDTTHHDSVIDRFADPRTGEDALREISKVGQAAVPRLRQELKSENRVMRGFAAIALADLGAPDADELLFRVVREFDYGVLPDPIFVLFEEATWRLRDSLEQGHEIVGLVDEMLRALAESSPDEAFWIDIRDQAINILGEVPGLQDERAVRVLLKAAAEDDAIEVAPLAVYALEEFAPDAAREARRIYNARPDARILSDEPSLEGG